MPRSDGRRGPGRRWRTGIVVGSTTGGAYATSQTWVARIRAPRGLVLRPQHSTDAEVQAALEEAEDAVELAALERQLLGEAPARLGEQPVARAVHPPRGRGAVDAERRRDLVDGHPPPVIAAERVAVLGPERARRLLERGADRLPVGALEVLELRVGRARRGAQHDVLVEDFDAAPVAAGVVEEHAERRDPEPSAEPATPRVVENAWPRTDEQLLPQLLAGIVTPGRRDAHPREGRVEVPLHLPVERLQRAAIAAAAAEGQVEVLDRERRRVGAAGQLARQEVGERGAIHLQAGPGRAQALLHHARQDGRHRRFLPRGPP